jgi:hypothetical protein
MNTIKEIINELKKINNKLSNLMEIISILTMKIGSDKFTEREINTISIFTSGKKQ